MAPCKGGSARPVEVCNGNGNMVLILLLNLLLLLLGRSGLKTRISQKQKLEYLITVNNG